MEADPCHVELVLEHLTVTTPLVKDKGDDPETPLTTEEASAYRSIARRIAYLAMGHWDCL